MSNAVTKTTGARALLLLVVSFVVSFRKVKGDGIIQVRLISFTNPGGKGGNGHCCDGKWGFCESGGGCDHFFFVCADEASQISMDSMNSCKFGKIRTGTTHNRATINFGSSIGDTTPNPLSFNFTSWPGSVVLKMQVWDDDGGGSSDDIVDFLKSSQPLRMSARKVTDRDALWTTATLQQRTSMRMELRVLCGVNWYGVECNIFCQPSRGPNAFYTCDNNGQKTCHEGWTGQNCDENIDECISLPCQNEGQCNDGLASYSCNCRPGYTGVNCETDIDDCVAVDCHKGTCVDGINQYTCQCQPGYTGETCQEIDSCLDHLCQNNGTCETLKDGFNCSCRQGWMGLYCEIDIDECSSDPCRNSLDCENTDGGFVCTCLPGWTGRKCDENIDECQSQPCANGGTCIDGIASYTCQCTDDWTPASNCLASPSLFPSLQQPATTACQQEGGGDICQNNGTCIESQPGTVIRCQCSQGWTGERCEDALDIACPFVNPCLNGGLCVSTLTTGVHYKCLCAKGYRGTRCHERDTDQSEENSADDDDDDDDDDDAQNKQKNIEEEKDASVWTFRGLLKDEHISTLLDLIANMTISAAEDKPGLLVDRQSTDNWDETSKANDVDVWHKVHYCDSQAPEEAKSVLLFRVTRGGRPIPKENIDRILQNHTDGNLRSQLPLVFLSAERQCTGTALAAQQSSETKFAQHRWPVIIGVVLFAAVVVALIVAAAVVLKRRKRQRQESESGMTNPIFSPVIADGREGGGGGGGRSRGEMVSEWDTQENGTRYTFNRDTQQMQSNLYMIPSHSYSQGVAEEDQCTTITSHS